MQEVDFPTQVLEFEDEQGRFSEAVPVGDGCLACQAGTTSGMGHMNWSLIAELCQSSESFRKVALRCSRATAGEVTETVRRSSEE